VCSVVGYWPAGRIFGTNGKDVIWCTKNALWLHPKVEEALDNGQIIVIPVKDSRSDRASRDTTMRKTTTKHAKMRFHTVLHRRSNGPGNSNV
jgi:hypothetical protein